MFELNQLVCFVTLAEELHFGRAAKRLMMTQPPLSRQIQLLEHQIDAKLFDRTSRSVRLTIAGDRFLPEARRVLRLAESASTLAKKVALGSTGSLRVGFTAASAYDFVPRLVTACLAELPNVDLSLKEMVTGDQLEALGSEEIDIGFIRPILVRSGIDSTKVFAEGLQAAIPSAHPLARKRQLTLKDLDDQPFIMYSPHESRYFYELIVGQLAQANVHPRYVQYLGQIHSVLSLVRAGLGLALVPQSASGLHLDNVTMRPITLRSKAPAEVHAVWRRDDRSPLVPTVVSIARRLANKSQRR
ncbi:MAG: LysR family transcriptional regulator [Bradyrhizobiaceae bacterium]|nr:MAG: LysR family transcriptional regulator [Bradyrhizobiaceae bacterium]